MNGALEEQMVGMNVRDKVWLGGGSTSGPLACDKSPSSHVDETLREEIYDN